MLISLLMGGVPHPVMDGEGYPIQSWMGVPSPTWTWNGYPHLDLGWGTPCPDLKWGTPPPPHRQDRVPPSRWWLTHKVKLLPSPILRMRAVIIKTIRNLVKFLVHDFFKSVRIDWYIFRQIPWFTETQKDQHPPLVSLGNWNSFWLNRGFTK